jgi:hypothetical protein
MARRRRNVGTAPGGGCRTTAGGPPAARPKETDVATPDRTPADEIDAAMPEDDLEDLDPDPDAAAEVQGGWRGRGEEEEELQM